MAHPSKWYKLRIEDVFKNFFRAKIRPKAILNRCCK